MTHREHSDYNVSGESARPEQCSRSFRIGVQLRRNTQGNNLGREKAEEEARSVGGKAIFPVFGPGENSYPGDLAKITPQSYRAHDRAQKRLDSDGAEGINATEKIELEMKLLSVEQVAALNGMRKHTDFNDLATRSVLGRE